MNASFVRLGSDESWVVFCRYQIPPEPGQGSIWCVRVGPNLLPSGTPMLLLGQGIDPRAIKLGNRVLIFFALIERDPTTKVPSGSCMAMAEYDPGGGQWTCKNVFSLPKRPIQGQPSAELNDNWEKNWIPFAIDATHVGLIYSHEPWDVTNASIPPNHVRALDVTDQINDPKQNVIDQSLSGNTGLIMAYGQSFLREELGKMYRGEIVLRCIPEIEPQDVLLITDPSTGMVGPVEVETVTHVMNLESGFITIIKPRAVITIDELHRPTSSEC